MWLLLCGALPQTPPTFSLDGKSRQKDQDKTMLPPALKKSENSNQSCVNPFARMLRIFPFTPTLARRFVWLTRFCCVAAN